MSAPTIDTLIASIEAFFDARERLRQTRLALAPMYLERDRLIEAEQEAMRAAVAAHHGAPQRMAAWSAAASAASAARRVTSAKEVLTVILANQEMSLFDRMTEQLEEIKPCTFTASERARLVDSYMARWKADQDAACFAAPKIAEIATRRLIGPAATKRFRPRRAGRAA